MILNVMLTGHGEWDMGRAGQDDCDTGHFLLPGRCSLVTYLPAGCGMAGRDTQAILGGQLPKPRLTYPGGAAAPNMTLGGTKEDPTGANDKGYFDKGLGAGGYTNHIYKFYRPKSGQGFSLRKLVAEFNKTYTQAESIKFHWCACIKVIGQPFDDGQRVEFPDDDED